MLTNRTFSTKAYDASYFQAGEGVSSSSRKTRKERTQRGSTSRLGHGYNTLERELIQALRDARALLCSEGDPDEDGAMIERIDTVLKRVGGR